MRTYTRDIQSSTLIFNSYEVHMLNIIIIRPSHETYWFLDYISYNIATWNLQPLLISLMTTACDFKDSHNQQYGVQLQWYDVLLLQIFWQKVFNILLKIFINNICNNFEISVLNKFDCTVLFTPFSNFCTAWWWLT